MADAFEPELTALQAILGALAPLDTAARARVLDATSTLLGRLKPQPHTTGDETPQLTPLTAPPVEPELAGIHDIRTLTQQKRPRSANEMAALAAYYLSELAPPSERSDRATVADVERLFKQAPFPLPRVVRSLLTNATAAGYFDALGGGAYRLNPVGYNLVAHGLPREGDQVIAPRQARRKSRSAPPTKATTKRSPSQSKRTRKRSTRKTS